MLQAGPSSTPPEARLEKRIEGVEGDYRRLVLTVTSMELCANAAG